MTAVFQLHHTDLTFHALNVLGNISATKLSIDLFISSEKLPEILKYIDNSCPILTLPALKIAGNMVTGNVKMTQYMLNHNIIEKIHGIISLADAKIRKEAFWSLSNIAAGSTSQLYLLVVHEVLHIGFSGLHDNDIEVRLEASWVYSIVARKGTPDMRVILVKRGILPHLKLGLDAIIDNPQYLQNLLYICKGVLKGDDNYNTIEEFDKSGCLGALERLMGTSCSKHCEMIDQILHEHFENAPYLVEMEQDIPMGFSI